MTTAIIQKTTESTDRQLAFITSLEGDHYGYHIRQFANWIRDNGRQLDRQTIIDYFTDLNGTNYAAGTKRIKRQALKKRLRQLAKFGGLGTQLNTNLEQFLHDLDHETTTEAPKINTRSVGRDKYLSKDEALSCIAACKSKRQECFIKFLWATGCRISELTGIRLSDCKPAGPIVNIRVTGKGNKERWIKISTSLFEEIHSTITGIQYLFETSQGKPYNRGYISNQIAKITKRATGRELRAHSLRHSFATRQIKEGVPISYVSRYLGHSSLSITSDLYDHGEIETGDLLNNEL